MTTPALLATALALVVALCLGGYALHARATSDVIKVTRIMDGDTFDGVWRGRAIRVRCRTFDAKESNEKGGKEATAALRRALVSASKVTLKDPDEKADRYGRVIATVMVDGKMLGAEMVAASMRARYLHGKTEFAAPWRGSRAKSWGRVQ